MKQLFLNRMPFFLSVFFAGGILFFLPFPDSKVAFQRLSSHLQPDMRSIRTQMRENCEALTAETKTEEAIAKNLVPFATYGTKKICRVKIDEVSLSRFHLMTNWDYGITITTAEKRTLFNKVYSVQFPRPLILLPVLIFFLSILYEFSYWTLGHTIASYLLLLFGLNFKYGIQEIGRNLSLIVETDKTWLGLCLLVLFLRISKHRAQALPERTPTSPAEIALNRVLLGFTGLWSPGFFTIFSVLLLPLKVSIRRLRAFFDGHVVICALSLYFLAGQEKPSLELLRSSVMLPRYFSFTFFLIAFAVYGNPRQKKQVPIWKLPDIRRYFAFVLIEEIIAFFVPFLKSIPTLSRVGLVLLTVEMTAHKHIQWKKTLEESALAIGGILLCALLSILSTEMGITDMGLALCQPQAHPTALVFFTYLAGLFLGILTGSFSAAFFAIIPHLTIIHTQPIAKAALLDGILAGNLLSPFSLFNVIPAFLFGLKIQELVRFRWIQLWIPLFIGGIIYAVSAVNSVAILRPVTFIFLCLLTAAIRLKRSEWRISRIWPWETRSFAKQPQ